MKNDDADYGHVERTYDEGSADYGDFFTQPHSFIDVERQQFIDLLPVGSKILDCGCGPGIDTERFTDLGYDVTAIDLSDRFVEFTKRRVPAASVHKMDMRTLAFPDGTFDGLWSSFSLLHVRAADMKSTLDGFRSVLRPGGIFFAALHRAPQSAWVMRLISGMERETHVQEWKQLDFEAVLSAAASR
ncbi:MAG: class I SAM-dependent methyltransferase [bacterium]